jgi:hypothetical protein
LEVAAAILAVKTFFVQTAAILATFKLSFLKQAATTA